MKKLILFAAAVAAIASCAKVETVNNSPMQEIAFKTYNPSMTKVAEGNYTEDANLVMGVSAVWKKHDGKLINKYFNNIPFMKGASTNWEGTPKQWWPKDGTLHFAVYGPQKGSNVTTTFTDEKNATIEFTKEDNGKEDFVYGVQLYEGTKANPNIPVQLKHTGTKVTFNVQSEKSDYNELYRVDKIELEKVVTKGKTTVTYTNGAPSVADWTSTDPARNLDSETEGIPAMTVTNSANKFWSAFVLPAATTDAVAAFTVHYSIKVDGDNTYEPCGSERFTVSQSNWVKGKEYTFNIIFKADEITFTPTVENWDSLVAVDKNITY